MDCAAASPSKPECCENSPIAATTSKQRGAPTIAIPDNDLPSTAQVTDDNDLKRIVYELGRIANYISATTTEAGPSVTRRRSCGILGLHCVAARDSDNKKSTLEAAEYDALGQQFTTLVIISTFTANLIIGFLTLAHNTIFAMPSASRVQNEAGMFFALGGMAIHSGVIIIAGRCAALALKYAKQLPVQAHLQEEKQKEKQQRLQRGRSSPESSSFTSKLNEDTEGILAQNEEEQEAQAQINQLSGPRKNTRTEFPGFITCIHRLFGSVAHNSASVPATPCSPVSSIALSEISQALHLSDFHRFLRVCETLQLIGTAIFFLGVMILIFMMFFHRVFPIMLLVGCVSGPCLMCWRIKFWKISATNQSIRLVKMSWRRWMGDKVNSPLPKMGDGVNGKMV